MSTTILLRAVVVADYAEQADLLRFALPSPGGGVNNDAKAVITDGARVIVDYNTRFIHPDVPDAASWPRARRMLLALRRLIGTQGLERIFVMPDFVDGDGAAELEALVRERKAWVFTDDALDDLDTLNSTSAADAVG